MIEKTAVNQNEAQDLFMKMARMSSFNAFDGDNVCDVLEENRNLWKSMMFGRSGPYQGIILRDLPDGYLNADTMWLMPMPGKEIELELLALRRFDADEVDWFTAEQAQSFIGSYGSGKGEKLVLRVWWD